MSDKKEQPLLDNIQLSNSIEAQEGRKALEMVQNIVDAIINGKQLDPAFYGIAASKTIKKLKKKKT